ncbi:MAG: hypothetical protein ACFFDT_12360 [Candidatus Hodarchaeota archaeon]
MEKTCIQSYFLANPLLIFNSKNRSFCCQISGVVLDLDKGLKIHSLQTKLDVISSTLVNNELDIIEIFTHLGILSELNVESTYLLSSGVSMHV